MLPLSLANKYFINCQQDPGGQQALFRGKILGPVHEMIPAYLCEMHQADEAALGIRNQIVLPLEALTGIYLYDDVEIWHLEWQRLKQAITDGKKTEREAAKRARRAQQTLKKQLESMAAAGVTIVEADPTTPGGLSAILAGLVQPQNRAGDAQPLQQPDAAEQDGQDADDDLDRGR